MPGDRFANGPTADFVVLTKTAAQAAAGKEHRAAAGGIFAGAADARLFPKVQRGAGKQQRITAAAAAARFGAVNAAAARAKGTVLVGVHQCHHLFPVFSFVSMRPRGKNVLCERCFYKNYTTGNGFCDILKPI